MEEIQSAALQRALNKRFSLLEKTRIHRIAEKCFSSKSNVPPVRERRFIVKGGTDDAERSINIIKEKVAADKVTYHPIDPEVIQKYNTWLAERKCLRNDLNHLGNYTSWIQGKRNPTALESRVLGSHFTRLHEMNSDCSDSLPSTPTMNALSVTDSDAERALTASLSPPAITDAMRILQEYVDSRRLRLIDLFTQLDKNKSWTLEKPELTKIGLSASQIEEMLGPLECLSFKAVKQASSALKLEQRLIKQHLKAPLPPIKPVEIDSDENVSRITPGVTEDNMNTPSEDSRNSSFSPLEWAQYSHRLVPSLESNLRDGILAFRDETWREYQDLMTRCQTEGLPLSLMSLAKGLLAPGDRRWEECTKHLRQMTGLEVVRAYKPDAGSGSQDSQSNAGDKDKADRKVSKYYDSSLQYRDMAKRHPGDKVKLSTGIAVIRPRTDCWMSYEEYLALTSKVRTKFKWIYSSNEPWCGHLLDKIRLCMPSDSSKNQAPSVFCHTASRNGAGARRSTGYVTNDGGYHQSSNRIRQAML